MRKLSNVERAGIILSLGFLILLIGIAAGMSLFFFLMFFSIYVLLFTLTWGIIWVIKKFQRPRRKV